MATYSLREHLTSLAYKEVRSIATRLGLRLRHQQQKADWITPIVTGWQTATTRHQWLAQLSVTAQEAMTRLLAAEQIPAALFWGEYGSVRQATANHHWTPPPWQAPATVSEELYYSGLLCSTPRPLARAHLVSLPVDLWGVLAAEVRNQKSEVRSQKSESPPKMLSSVPLPSVPLSSVPLPSVPLSSVPLPSVPLPSVPLPSVPLPSVPLPSVPLPPVPLPSVPLPSVPLPSVPLSSATLPSVPLPSVPLPSVPLPSVPLPSVPLPSVPLPPVPLPSVPLPSVPLPSVPLSSATLPSVPLPSVPLPSVPLPSVPLPSVPLPSVPLPPVPLPSVPLPSVPLPSVPLSSATLPSVPLPSVPLPSVPLPSVPLPSVPLPSVPLSSVPLPAGWPLCHDVGQLLIYLPTEAGGRLLQGRWLSRAQSVALNGRLLAPVAVASITSHRRTPYLRLLMFLATVGDLQHQGQVTPAGWQWLAAAPAEQLAWLQQSWLTADPADRQAYALPDGAVARPWPQPLAHHLSTLAASDTAAPFTAVDLVHGLLRAEQPVAAFWGANFHSLTDLDTVVARLLVEVLQPVALVAPQAADHTPAESWLACAPVDQSALPAAASPLPLPARLHSAAAAYDLYLPAGPTTGHLAAQAQISRYGRYQLPAARTTDVFHHYQLTPITLAAAAAAGHGLATLSAALATVGLALTPAQHATLAAWHEQGRQLAVQHLPLLRTQTPAQLAALLQNPTIRAALGEVLAPTAALLTGDSADFARLLQRQGYAVAAPLVDTTTAPEDAATGALWLAGRLYAALGDQLPLPLPLPFAALDQLLAQLPTTAQAALQAQWLQLHEQLLTLLDNLPYTPPPQPSDPAQWRPIITRAIDANQLLRLTYHSAGRNLTTERLVQPYWVEEHRGIPYLRAYCHNAGRVLTFRLDRIAAVMVKG